MLPLQLKLLGGFEARLSTGTPVVLARRKAQALLAYLALQPGQIYLRDKLAALLWGESTDTQARHSLRQALLAIKQALPIHAGEIVRIANDTVTLNHETVEVDVAVFERLVLQGTPEALVQACALYRGEFLEGLSVREDSFEDWLMTQRERLRELAVEALVRLLAQQLQFDWREAVHTAARLLSVDPLQEAAHRTLMLLYARQGRRGAALRQYQICAAVLRRELGVEPETATSQLYQEILQSQIVPSASESAANRPTDDAADLRSDASVPDAPLVGRETEMAALRRVRADAWRGQARTAVVQGEAGIGKSRLIDAFVADSIKHGGRALLGRAHETERILPFGPWVDAFRSAGVVAELTRQPDLSATWREQLTRLFPELGTPRAVVEGEEHVRLFEAMAHAVGHLATRRPLLLVLEDLHWADDMSLRLLAFLSRRGAAWPVLLVATVRTEEMIQAPAVTRLLHELSNDRHFASLTLAPLSAPDTVTLVRLLARAGTDEPAVQRLGTQIWRASEGNPFMVVETMRSLYGTDATEISGELPTPPRVRDIITARLDRLSQRGRDLVALASVIGAEFDFALLERAAGADGSQTATTVEELVAHRVLHVVDERLDFTHDRIREVAYERLLPPRRKLLHAAVASALESLYANELAPREDAESRAQLTARPVRTPTGPTPRVTEIARHCFLSLPLGDARRATHFSLLAGRRAAMALAYEHAATWFTRALQALSSAGDADPTAGDPPDTARQRCELLIALGEARARAGDTAAARDAFFGAADLARGLSAVELLTRAALGLAGGADITSRVDAATMALLEEALAAGGATDSPSRARLLSRLATGLYFSDAADRRARLSRQAVEIAERLGDPVTLALVLHNRHFAILGPDTLDERTAMASRMIVLGEQTARKDLTFAGHYWQLVDALERGEIAVVDASQQCHAALAEELGQPFHRWRVGVLAAMRAVLAGRLADAERLIEEALYLGRRATPNALLVYGVQLYGLRREQGRLDEIEPAIRAFAAEHAAMPAFRSGLALLCCYLGRLAEARTIFDELADQRFDQFPRDANWINAMDELAQVCATLGDRERAALLYERLAPYESRNVVVAFAEACEGSVARYLGLLAATLARWDDAARHFDAALSMNSALGAWPQLAHTQREYAAMLRARGAPGDEVHAAALQAAARTTYVRLGMSRFAESPERLELEAR